MAFRGGLVATSINNATLNLTVNTIGIALGDIIVIALCHALGDTLTWPSGFVVVPGTSSEPNDGNSALHTFYKVATSTEVSATTLSITGITFGSAASLRVYSGRNQSSPFTTNASTTHSTAAAFPVTFSKTGLTAASGDDVVEFTGEDITGGSTSATLSYNLSSGFANGQLANDTVTVNANWVGSSDLVNTSGATGTIAGSISVTSGATPGSTGYLAQVISIAAAPFVADGHVAASTTVATGTGGAGMAAVATGQVIDVLFRASSASAHTCTCADQLGNTYTQIDHNDSTASHSLEWYHFYSLITIGGTPVITCTYGASAQLDVAAAILSGLYSTPFTAGQVANHFQTGASIGAGGTDLQSSTNTPALATQPVLLGSWGYCDANGTPSYGSAFTGVGTAWSTLGSGTARLAYETETYNSTIAVSGRFTPVPNQDAYTFLAAFNLPPSNTAPFTPFRITQFFVSDIVIQT